MIGVSFTGVWSLSDLVRSMRQEGGVVFELQPVLSVASGRRGE
jgi:hypothetical protein